MNNRWSDAARAASIAVRQGHKLLAGRPVQKQGRKAAPKPMVKKPATNGSGRNNPGPHIWMPPRDDPRHPSAGGATGIPLPNIFYSSSYPYGPGQEGRRGILRYDPKNPLDAEELGYNMGKWNGKWKKSIPPVSERYKDDWLTKSQRRAKEAEEARKRYPRPSSTGPRVIIGGKRYTRVGNKLAPDVVETGKISKVYYQK